MTHLKYTVAAFALFPIHAFAQSATEDSIQKPIVVTATRAEQSPGQVGQAITVIDAKTLETRQSVALSDILSTTPGVTVARTGGIGSQTSLFIRGATSDHTLVVIDGVRVNDPSTPGGSFDFGNLLSGNIDHVEILRGADSVPWGSAAIGGVVNITTRAPTGKLSGGFSAEAGSFNTKNVNGHIAGTYGPVALSLGAGWFNTDGISAFAKNEGGSESDGFDQHYVNGRAIVTLSDNIALDFRGRYVRGNLNIDGTPAPFYVTADTLQYGITRELSGYAGINANFMDGRFKNRLGISTSDINRKSYDPAKATPLTGAYIGSNIRIEYQGDFAIIDQARIVFGAEHEKSSYQNVKTASVFRTGLNSLFAQIITTPIEAITLTGGVRYDDHQVYGNATTFSANAALHATDTTIIRASYAEGFKAPTLYQRYGDAYTSANAALKPETAVSYDLGIEQSALNGVIRANATYFNRKTKNLIGYIDGGFPTYIGTYSNINRANAEGIEFALTLNPIATLNISANYTHSKSIDASTGLRLLRRPDDSIAFNIDYDAGAVKLGVTLQTVGDSFDIDYDAPVYPSPTVQLNGYTLVGLRAAVPILNGIELYGRIENLFDERYQVVKHYGTMGRNATIGLRAKF